MLVIRGVCGVVVMVSYCWFWVVVNRVCVFMLLCGVCSRLSISCGLVIG